MIDLKVFEQWIMQKIDRWKDRIESYEIKYGPSHYDKRSMMVLIETKDRSGQILFWESGESDAEIVDWKTADRLYPDHYIVVSSPSEFENAYREFFDLLFP